MDWFLYDRDLDISTLILFWHFSFQISITISGNLQSPTNKVGS